MCDGERRPGPIILSRRGLLAGTVAATGTVLLHRGRPAQAAPPFATVDLDGVAVVPRAEWGGDLSPVGPVPAEPDVRYLLVHHSVDPGNEYGEADVAGILRGFVRFHTAAAKGWPDLAYNFLVDRFGRVWEGRTGSIAGPVAGDATGGNQGYDQLCCFIGDHQAGDPSPEAFSAMARLLAALARRSGVALGEGATATFTSRGSNRHPAGTTVTTATVAGHREMSRTQCPGDRVFARLPELRRLAAASGPAAVVVTPPPVPPPATGPEAPAAPSPAPVPAAGTTAPAPAPTGAPVSPGGGATPARPSAAAARSAPAPADEGRRRVGPAAAAAAAAVASAAAAGVAASRRARRAGPGAPPPAGTGVDPPPPAPGTVAPS